ncbi:6-phosphogluconolactonase [Dongia rigui]|uniref:6-phosphogluconolactonase n=1 Tax=Dongia rigui TaxID=940149 RepID=A0ABU5E2P8_9PROT|nr:6-phosphogluconolactonase [Dongia rigui]MDY0873484.1 6-phosphogluconolactonase [Dongia rigui]
MTVRTAEYADRGALVAAVAAQIVKDLQAAVSAHGSAILIVPGGTTPVAVFEHLAATPFAWDKVTVVPCDERWVGIEHPDSNEGLIRRHLLQGEASAAGVLGLYRQTATPAEAVDAVAAALAKLPRPFSSVFLGMGEDGHFASLFPGRQQTPAALDLNNKADIMVLPEPAKGHPRIGLTLSALVDCSHVLLAVTGAEKRIVLDRAMADINADTYPIAALLRQTRTPVDIFTGA